MLFFSRHFLPLSDFQYNFDHVRNLWARLYDVVLPVTNLEQSLNITTVFGEQRAIFRDFGQIMDIEFTMRSIRGFGNDNDFGENM